MVRARAKALAAAAAAASALAVGFGGASFVAAAPSPPLAVSDPMIIAHRGGTVDFPENTILAIENATQAGVDAVWLTVQVSSDGVPVLYRPADLATLTDASGPVNSKTASELMGLNAGWNFTRPGVDGHPYRERPTPIPALAQAIASIPLEMPLFLDLKQTPAEPLVAAVANVLREAGAASRSIVYSTDADITDAASHEAGLRVAESRDITRQRLLNMALNDRCAPPPAPGTWVGFEFRRELTVTEKFTLGTGVSPVDAELWDPKSLECFKSQGEVKAIAFGVNTLDEYNVAKKIGLDAVLVDSPQTAQQWRASKTPYRHNK